MSEITAYGIKFTISNNVYFFLKSDFKYNLYFKDCELEHVIEAAKKLGAREHDWAPFIFLEIDKNHNPNDFMNALLKKIGKNNTLDSTLIFKDYKDFCLYTDNITKKYNKKIANINGVSEKFAKKNLDYKKQNESNKGCWNCLDCKNCKNCNDCINCEECENCKNCTGCRQSEKLKNCINCEDCINCYYCNNLQDAEGCGRDCDCY